MNKILVFLTLILAFTTLANEPKKLKVNDLVEDMARSEIEIQESNIEIENITPVFEIPEFKKDQTIKKTKSKRNIKPSKVKTLQVKKTKKPSKSKVLQIQNDNAKEIKPKNRKINKRIIIAKKPIKSNLFRSKDTITVEDGVLYLSRGSSKGIIKYKIDGEVPLDSTALLKTNTGYSIISSGKLRSDIREMKKDKSQKQVSNDQIDLANIEELRRMVEGKYNRNKKIKKSITALKLRKNDTIYIVNGIKFISRIDMSTYSSRKYWLTGPIDLNNKVLKKVGKNKYKVKGKYKN